MICLVPLIKPAKLEEDEFQKTSLSLSLSLSLLNLCARKSPNI